MFSIFHAISLIAGFATLYVVDRRQRKLMEEIRSYNKRSQQGLIES